MELLENFGRPIAQPAFRILAYIDGSLNDAPDKAAAGALLELFLQHYQTQLAWVVLSSGRAKTPKAPSEKTLAPVRAWIEGSGKTLYEGFRMNGPFSEALDAVTVPHINIFEHHNLWVVEMSVPHDDPRVTGFAQAASEVLANVNVRSAVMGMGFYQPQALSSLVRELPLGFGRYRCAIEIQVTGPMSGIRREHSPFPYEKYSHISPGIADLGWMVIVGAPFLERIADQPHPQHAGLELRKRSGQMVLTAGASPIWGDVNTGEDIGAYQAMAAYLAPIRYHPELAYRSLFASVTSDPEGRDRVDGYLERFDVHSPPGSGPAEGALQ